MFIPFIFCKCIVVLSSIVTGTWICIAKTLHGLSLIFTFETFPDRDYETYFETYPYGSYGACQCGGGQAGGEDEPWPVTPDHVNCTGRASYVSTYIPKSLPWRRNLQLHIQSPWWILHDQDILFLSTICNQLDFKYIHKRYQFCYYH